MSKYAERLIALLSLPVLLFPAMTAIACIQLERSDSDFHYSEERVMGSSLWLEYWVAPHVPSHALNVYAERRARQLCGGDFRYLSDYARPGNAKAEGEASFRKLELTVECLK